MDRLLCLHPLFHSLLVTFERANVKPFSLKAYIYPVFPGFCLEDTPEAAGIVLPAFALLQYFHTGAVYPVELLAYSFLIFALQTAAAPDASLYKSILCDGGLRSAVAEALPVDRTLPVPLLKRLYGCQPPELSACQIYSVVGVVSGAAAAAFDFSRLQVPGSRLLLFSALTSAQPLHSQHVLPYLFSARLTTVRYPNTCPVRSSAIFPLLASFLGMQPQLVTVPLFSRFVFTVTSLPQSHLHSQSLYLFSVCPVFSITVR